MNKEIITVPSIDKANYSINVTRMSSSAYYPIIYMWRSKWENQQCIEATHVSFCGDLATYKNYGICNRLSKIILENDYV